MLRPTLILTTLSVIIVSAEVAKFRAGWNSFKATHQVQAIQPQPENAGLPKIDTGAPVSKVENWAVIPAQNPFSLDRTDSPLVTAPEAPKPKPPKPRLFGTIAIGADRAAMVGPANSANRSHRPMKVGEKIDEWTLVEITDNAAIVEFEGSKERLTMNDPTAEPPRAYERTDNRTNNPPPPRVTAASSSAPVASSAPPGGPAAPAPAAPAPSAAGGQKTRIVKTPWGNEVVVVEPN